MKQDFKKTYAGVLQGTNNINTNVSITNKSNNTKAENESQTLFNKLKTLNPNKRPQSRGKSPSRSTSETRQEPSPRDKEIEIFEKRNTNFKTISNQQHHLRQSKKRATDLHTGRLGHKQHRNNKCTYLYPTSNGNTMGTQRAIKSKN